MKILIASSSYGEEECGALIAEEIKKISPQVNLIAAPYLSSGEKYIHIGAKLITKGIPPPSGGFPTMSVTNFFKDLPKFYLPLRYYLKVKQLSPKEVEALVVGDVFLLVLVSLALHKRVWFLALAKSNLIEKHYKIEEYWMKKFSKKVFCRDSLTADSLRREGISAVFLGNPIIDKLKPINRKMHPQFCNQVVGLLPGSREEGYKNFVKILKVVEKIKEKIPTVKFVSPLTPTIKLEKLKPLCHKINWHYEEGGNFFYKNNTKVYIFYEKFHQVISSCRVVIGLAGTANEEVVYMGIPVVSFKGSGGQSCVKRMKRQEKLLKGGIKFVENYPDGVVREVVKLVREKNYSLSLKLPKNTTVQGGAKRIAKHILTSLK